MKEFRGAKVEGIVRTDGTNLRGRIFSGLGWMLTGSVGQYAAQTSAILVMARFLTPGDFGLVSASMVAIGFLSIFSEMGVGPALVQKENIEPADIGTANVLSVGFGFALAGLIYLASGAVADFFRMPELADVVTVLSIMLPASGISVVGLALLQRELRFRKIAVLNVVSYGIAYIGVGVPLVVLGAGIWSLVGAYLLQSVLLTCLVLASVPGAYKVCFSSKSAARLLDFGLGFSIARISNYFSGQGDNIVAGRYLGGDALGLYGRAYQLMTMPAVLIGTVLDKVFFPVMAGMKSDNNGLSKIYLASLCVISLIAFPLGAFIAVFSKEIVVVLLGDKWLEAAAALRILSFSLMFRMSYKMSDSLVRAKGAVYRRAWRQVIFALSVFLFSWIGRFWGVNGIAAGVALSIFLNFCLMLALSKRLIGFTWSEMLYPQGKCLLLGGGVAIQFMLLKHAATSLGLSGIGTLCIGMLGAGVIFLVAVKYMLPEDERRRISGLKVVSDRIPVMGRLLGWVIR